MHEQRQLFQRVDSNSDGIIQKDELAHAFRLILDAVSDREVDTMIRAIDLNGNGIIEFSEWLVATTDRELLLQDERLNLAFKFFNKAGDGKISITELQEFMGNTKENGQNANLDEQVYRDIMNEVDDDRDGVLTLREFKAMMHKLRFDSSSGQINFLPFKPIPEQSEHDKSKIKIS